MRKWKESKDDPKGQRRGEDDDDDDVTKTITFEASLTQLTSGIQLKIGIIN